MRRGFAQEDAERAAEAISGFNLSALPGQKLRFG